MKNKQIFLLTSFLFLTIFQTDVRASNIELTQNKSNREIDLIENLLVESDRAFNQEDLKAVMDSMHPNSPLREDIQKLCDYSLTYMILTINMIVLKLSRSRNQKQ
jgi:hypothetical protein